MNIKPDLYNSVGVIPPVNDLNGASSNRSPYKLPITDFVDLFAYTQERIEILEKFLEYRLELYKVGIVKGFQWINGSFTTDVEVTENRPPNDIDVVTFFELPNGETQMTFMPKTNSLLDKNYTKPKFKVDAYGFVIGERTTPYVINNIAYWYSMWSHRKNDNMWKGFIQVELSPNDDHAVLNNLRGGTM